MVVFNICIFFEKYGIVSMEDYTCYEESLEGFKNQISLILCEWNEN